MIICTAALHTVFYDHELSLSKSWHSCNSDSVRLSLNIWTLTDRLLDLRNATQRPLLLQPFAKASFICRGSIVPIHTKIHLLLSMAQTLWLCLVVCSYYFIFFLRQYYQIQILWFLVIDKKSKLGRVILSVYCGSGRHWGRGIAPHSSHWW